MAVSEKGMVINMKKLKLSKALYICCNICLIAISVISILYSITSLILSNNDAKTIFNMVNKDYEACFGKKYVHEDTYFTDITCMKMKITSTIITKSAGLKNQYYDSIQTGRDTDSAARSSNSNNRESEAVIILKDALSDIQDYNKAIPYKKHSLLLLNNSNSLYSALNYMIYGNDALLKDTINFINDKEALSLATEKDIQEIHVMANMSKNIVLNLDKHIYFYKYTILAGLLLLLGACINIYRINARKKKYRRKKFSKKKGTQAISGNG